jgi:hypothetical protein
MPRRMLNDGSPRRAPKGVPSLDHPLLSQLASHPEGEALATLQKSRRRWAPGGKESSSTEAPSARNHRLGDTQKGTSLTFSTRLARSDKVNRRGCIARSL